MKIHVALLIIVFSFSMQAQNIDFNKVHIIEAKIGLADYPIDKTTLPEIIDAFGNNYERKFGSLNDLKEKTSTLPILCEVKYKDIGISFYYLDIDSVQTIKAVKFYKPFKVRTKTKIILNKSTIGDVQKKYKNSKIYISNNIKGSEITINRFLLEKYGIYFSSKISNSYLGKFPSKKAQKLSVVDEIYISNYQHYHLLN